MRNFTDHLALLSALAITATATTAFADPVAPPPNVVMTNEAPEPTFITEPEELPVAKTLLFRQLLSDDPVSTLIENAEGDNSNLIIDIGNGGGLYDVVQQLTVIEGDTSFHLSNTGFADSSITIMSPIEVTAGSKLFFESWLRFVTTNQTAKVQVSTDGGNTWPDTIYSLTGIGAETQGASTLNEIDLAAYVGQTIRIRFFMDWTGGGLFQLVGSESFVGWFFDNIQVGTSLTKRLYSIGEPTDEEQLYVELINRARADAAAEAQLLKNTTDPDVLSAINFFSVNLDQLVLQFATLTQTAQPVSINEKLTAAARLHSQDQFDNTFQGHSSSPTPPAPNASGDTSGNRATKQGYNWSGIGENVFSFADTTFYGHAGFNIDWGNDAFGMQVPPGHRNTIHNNNFKEIGVGIVEGNKTGLDWTTGFVSNTTVGPQLVTQDFATPQEDNAFITGVIFDDADGDKFYDPGEGVGGVRVDIAGSVYYTISSSSGGYSVPVSADGEYAVIFQAPGFANYTDSVTVSSLENEKVDWRRLQLTVSTLANSPSDLMSISFTSANHSPAASFKLLKSSTPGGTYSEVVGALPTGPVDGVLTFTYQRAPNEEVYFRVEITD